MQLWLNRHFAPGKIFTATLAAGALFCACSKKAALPGDAKTADAEAFKAQWRDLAAHEVFYIEDDGGQGLMGRVPRASHLPDKPSFEPDEAGESGADLHPVRPPVPVAPTVTVNEGKLPEALTFTEVSSVVRRNLGGVRVCYLKLAQTGVGVSGRAIVSFSVKPAGKVEQLRVDAPVFRDTSLPDCVAQQVKNWSFPQTQKGGANVQYPLVFVGS